MHRDETNIPVIRERLQALMEEYLELESELRHLEDTRFRVFIAGSARIRPHDPLYQEIYRLARGLAACGMDIVTGGGPGLMEAANRAVRDEGNRHSTSYGLPILMPRVPEDGNHHLDIKSEHKRFSSRLDEFMRLSHAVIIAPGGIGTLLELLYVWQLLQVGMMERHPVILLGTSFWRPLLAWMEEQLLGGGFVSLRDFDCVRLVDSIEETVGLLQAEQRRYETARQVPKEPALLFRSPIEDTAEAILFDQTSGESLVVAAGRRSLP